MHNGVFCITDRLRSIYMMNMYKAKAYSASSSTSPLTNAFGFKSV
jgi:hypothetical protein